MSKKTATITFHAAHNYGSMLQAYALQQSLLNLGYDNEIINLRTDRQLKLYAAYYDINNKNIKSLARWIFTYPYRKSIRVKYHLFEDFLKHDLRTTQEYKTLEELKQASFSYDCYISGGDQIWNTSPEDFDWSYYLPFVKSGKRISYAVSMGPKASSQVTNKDLVQKYLRDYDHISVREEGTAAVVRSLVDVPVSQELDPALLLSGDEWRKKFNNEPIIEGDYILLYSPGYKKSVYDMAAYISKKLKMKVVVTLFSRQDYAYHFKSQIATGPWEFLNLIQNARLVVSGSFHALVFATLFHTPFYAVNGDKDNRMVTFLKNMRLQARTINVSDCDDKLQRVFDIDFSEADVFLSQKRRESLSFLINSIEK